jgi:SAM-dependent methyltransferase
MNLFYLVAKNNDRFRKSRDVRKFRVQRNGLTWRGARVENGGSLYVERATECQPFRGRCGSPGWFVQGVGGAAELAIRFRASGAVVAERKLTASGEGLEPVVLPWPVEPSADLLDLEIVCSGPAPAFVASHFELDRNVLIGRCRGRGAELGPGPNPHILPSPGIDIVYVEQKAPDEWVTLYGDHYKVDFNPALAAHYVVGEAHQIPAAPESLDFIYSSHVFEHLVNPIGHLEIWSGLLRKGGEVLMVVPDYIGSKDYLANASTMEAILSELHSGTFAPSLEHYQRYAAARGSPKKAQKLFDLKSSIHMHFYTNENMRSLLEYVVQAGLFDSYSILHSANAKDFHVILAK